MFALLLQRDHNTALTNDDDDDVADADADTDAAADDDVFTFLLRILAGGGGGSSLKLTDFSKLTLGIRTFGDVFMNLCQKQKILKSRC